MRANRIVVVLEVQWGYPGDRPLRWFYINPFNHSGRRLIQLVGHMAFKVTNACSDIVYSARDRGTPDPAWLRANLKALRPDLVIVAGKVATATFHRSMVPAATRVLKMPHPAARTWSKALIAKWARRIQSVKLS